MAQLPQEVDLVDGREGNPLRALLHVGFEVFDGNLGDGQNGGFNPTLIFEKAGSYKNMS